MRVVSLQLQYKPYSVECIAIKNAYQLYFTVFDVHLYMLATVVSQSIIDIASDILTKLFMTFTFSELERP